MSDGLAVGRSSSRQNPGEWTRAPASTAPRTSSRTYRAFPRPTSVTQSSASSSTGSPSTASTSARTFSSLSSPSSSRGAVSSFHSETIASGHGSPARTVARMNADEEVAR